MTEFFPLFIVETEGIKSHICTWNCKINYFVGYQRYLWIFLLTEHCIFYFYSIAAKKRHGYVRFRIKYLDSNILNFFRVFFSSFNMQALMFSISEYFTKFLAAKVRIFFQNQSTYFFLWDWEFFFIIVHIIVSWKAISWSTFRNFCKWILKIWNLFILLLKPNVYVSNFWEPN